MFAEGSEISTQREESCNPTIQVELIQPINQSNNIFINQLINQSINLFINHIIKLSINQWIYQSINQFITPMIQSDKWVMNANKEDCNCNCLGGW